MKRYKPLEVRYRIEPSGCWVWLKDIKDGYGRIGVNGKKVQAHRYVYELHKGEIPAGYHIDHLCRNRSCVNPAHLEAVTPTENNRRIPHRRSMLTEEEVLSVRKQLANGVPLRQLARELDVYFNTIYCIAHGITYHDQLT